MTLLAATTFTVGILATVLFQWLLVAGRPWGHLTMGGKPWSTR